VALAPADRPERGMHPVPGSFQENPSRNIAPRVFAVLALVAAGIVVVALVAGSLGGSGSSSSSTGSTTTTQQASGGPDPYAVVGPGDSLSSIAAQEGVSEARLERLNPNLDPQQLQPQNCVDIVPHGCRKLVAKSGG
jgi:LysM repeat protein